MDVAAIGFDLDETLAGIARPRSRVLADATDRAGAPPISREAYLEAHAEHSGEDTREPVFAALLDETETSVSAAELAAAYHEAVVEALTPVDGVETLLANLRGKYRVGLLTDGPVEAQRGKLDRLDWSEEFHATVITGALPAPKPDPRAFNALTEALDVAAERTVYIGDHPGNDIQGARDAGMTSVQVVYDGGPDPHPAARATVPRTRLATELPALLGRLAAE
jgi:putative hydrolase of the HAD superfamily